MIMKIVKLLKNAKIILLYHYKRYIESNTIVQKIKLLREYININKI